MQLHLLKILLLQTVRRDGKLVGSLFNILRDVPGDVRRYTTVDPTSVINQNYDQPGVDYIGTDVLAIDKYPGRTGVPLRNDIKVFRLSEMYLILAECYAHDGALNGASNSVASVLKQIRDARNFLGAQPLPNYADATAAYADIVLERRKELSFEGHRYIDAKRLGAVSGTSISRHITDDSNQTIPLTLPYNDYRMTMPIPRQEMNANGNMTQNPEY
ncbi:MAG: RagB/SusD family nutrient uptake outer membrane protein [Flavobacterium sp.]